jgi:hypothetical protein
MPLRAGDFESPVSANFTIRALGFNFRQQLLQLAPLPQFEQCNGETHTQSNGFQPYACLFLIFVTHL